MKKMILLFSHKLTEIQKEDAKKSLNVDDFIYLPDILQKQWSNIPPKLENLTEYLKPLEELILINATINDYILIQGDFGGVYHMVNFTKKYNFIAVHSTTTRDVKEEIVNGEIIKTSIFKHIIFREY